MGIINLSEMEKTSLKSIDANALDKLIDQAVEHEQLGPLYQLPLSTCGPYVSTKLQYFEGAIRDYSASKSDKKREETHYRARRAAIDLMGAFREMKARMDTEERQGELFRVNDHMHPPSRYSENLQVRVGYQWRRTLEEPWTDGSITFQHTEKLEPIYGLPSTKRKPTAAKVEQRRQEDLARTWEHFMMLALCSVRDYFQSGGDGSKIPDMFKAKPDAHGGGLNNFSADFWRNR